MRTDETPIPLVVEHYSDDPDELRRQIAFRDVEIIRLREIIRRLNERVSQ